MSRPLRPRLLLEHAHALANHHSGAGRPQVTWLRRSVSASYYAVFHAISLAVADQIAPTTPREDRYRLSRSLDHRRVKEVCIWVSSTTAQGREQVRPIIVRLQQNNDVADLAAIFTRLQQARHAADYDHLADIRKAATLFHHAEAERALDLVQRIAGSADGRAFLALLALHTSLS